MARLEVFKQEPQNFNYYVHFEGQEIPRDFVIYVPGDGGGCSELMAERGSIAAACGAASGGISFFTKSIAKKRNSLYVFLANLRSQHPHIRFHLVTTSSGSAVASLMALTDIRESITGLLHLDPANYAIDSLHDDHAYTWNGLDNYNIDLNRSLAFANSLWAPHTFVMTVNFLLKNCLDGAYPTERSYQERGAEITPEEGHLAHERIHELSSKAYHQSVLQSQHASLTLYKKDYVLPHAFLRDGDIAANKQRVMLYIQEFLHHSLPNDFILD